MSRAGSCARLGAVACEPYGRAATVSIPRADDSDGARGLHRATPEPCVSLAGVPRFIPKLHRPWPGGRPPVRANSSLVQDVAGDEDSLVAQDALHDRPHALGHRGRTR